MSDAAPNRFNVSRARKIPYLLLFFIFTLLTGVLIFVYLQISRSASLSSATPVDPAPTSVPTLIPTDTPEPSITPVPSSFIPSDQFLPTAPPSRQKPSSTPKPSAAPTSAATVYTNQADKFSVTYSSSRKVYEESPDYGHRHVFYAPDSIITVHVGTQWSWVNDGRTFSSAFLVAGQNTYVYDISTQKIVDFEANGLNYTIQCVHNAKAAAIKECLDFIQSFKLTS